MIDRSFLFSIKYCYFFLYKKSTKIETKIRIEFVSSDNL
jgi:hypothetical protein